MVLGSDAGDTGSRASLSSRGALPAPRRRPATAAAPPTQDAFLALRDECGAAKQRAAAAEDKIKQ